MAERIEIVEVGPRDGLQNEATFVAVAEKIALIDALSACGFTRIESASFVSPKWVPQMAGSAEVLAGIRRRRGVAYTALTPNMRGLEDAIAAKADEVAIFGAASESFSKANINASIDESFERFAPLCARARDEGIPVRGYVSCVTDCPYEGAVAPDAVASVAARLMDLGCYEVSLGETLGRGKPQAVAAMLEAVTKAIPAHLLAGHFHDTSGQALANIDVAIDAGLRVFDSAIGGLGGCPYAPGAAGNVSTSAVVEHVEARGFETDIDRSALSAAAEIVARIKQKGSDHVET